MPLPRVARTRSGHVWGETWRLFVAFFFGMVVWAFMQAELDAAHAQPRFGEAWVAVDVVIGVVATGLLLWRRRWPLQVAVVTAVLSGVSSVSIGASAVALVSLSTRRRWSEVAIAAVPFLAAGFVHQWIYRADLPPETLTSAVIGTLSLATLVAIGWAIGERRAFVASLHDRAVTAEREQSLRVVQAQVAERARIAREMHDVLAHRISLVAVHSGALAYRTDLSPEQVRETAEIVRESANRALTELRAVLGVLRDVPTSGPAGDDRSPTPARPQPTLRDLDSLVTEARAAGATVALDRSGDLDDVPEPISRSAYRIVQECLTNVRKHAPGRAAQVKVDARPDQDGTPAVRVTVRNGIPPRDPARHAPEGAGLGLIGLTERAVLSGGELTYGADRRGDFVVSARLPWEA